MRLMKIDEIFNFEKGVLQSSKCVPGEYNFITASSDWKTHNEYTHDCEALIFAAAASGSLGRTHYVNGKFISSDLCFIITPKDQENLPVDLKFYHILFNELKDEIVRNTKAGTSKEAIGLGSFGKYQLPYFDIDTQIEIKNRFVNSEVLKSDLSNELNHQVDLVKKLRQQLLQDAVQGKLVEQNLKDEPASELLKKIKAALRQAQGPKKVKELPPIKPEEIPFEIPENWVWCRLGEICDTRLGKMLDGTKNKGEFYPYFRNLNVQWYRFELDDVLLMKFESSELEEYSVKKGDLLICEGGYPGRGAIWESDDETYKFQKALHRIRFYNSIPAKLYLFYLDLICSNGRIDEYLTGSGIQHLTGISLKKMPVPLPPLSEQTRIVQKLDELMQYCNELEASIKQSESQNEKLLQQVLREALRKETVIC
jgi:type I restriction enzyme, S subunit